jgi:hypothetical protein
MPFAKGKNDSHVIGNADLCSSSLLVSLHQEVSA